MLNCADYADVLPTIDGSLRHCAGLDGESWTFTPAFVDDARRGAHPAAARSPGPAALLLVFELDFDAIPVPAGPRPRPSAAAAAQPRWGSPQRPP